MFNDFKLNVVFFYNSGQPGKENSDATKQEIENDKAR